MVKSKTRNRFQLSALATALCLFATGADAAGLGRITVLSALGQSLRAEIDVNASPEEVVSMNARVASPEAFRQVGIEYAPSVSAIRFVVEKRKDGQPYLRMVSDRAINDPFLDVLVELTWSSGRMVREYTLLLDPPEGLSATAPVAVAAPATSKSSTAPKVAPAPLVAPVSPAPVSVAASEKPESVVAKPVPGDSGAAPVGAGERSAVSPAEGAVGHLVKRGETLRTIAATTKPEGVGLDQMLVALFQGNRDAFEGGNMNRLRAGKILSIPSAETATAVSPADARQVVIAQSRDFNTYRNKLAASVAREPAKDEAAKQQDQGKIGPKIAEKPAAVEPAKDKLEVSRTEAAKNAKALQGRISALEEDLVARDRALKEANSRVADLEKNVADLKKLAELKSKAGVQMQKQAEAAKPVAESKPVEAAPVAPIKPVEAPKATAEPPKPAEVAKTETEAPKPVEAPVAAPVVEAPKTAEQAPAQTAKPPVPVAVPAQAPEEPSFIDENPLLVYGGGGLAALLLAYVGISVRRRKAKAEEPVPTASRLSEGDLMANSVFGTTGGQAVDTSASIQTDFSQASLSAIDTDEGVDPVAEADVYMAYGRDAQAEEILVDALKTDPTRLAIYLKLLEIYSSNRNLPKFEKVASDLKVQTGGSGSDWDKAAAMGRALDPGNPLYAGEDVAAEQSIEPVVVPEISSSKPSEPLLPKLDTTVTMPGQLSQLAQSATPAASSAADNLGFDLDFGAPEVKGVPASAPSSSELDFDLGMQPAATASAPQAGTLDVDLSLPEAGVAPIVAQPAVATEAAGGLDFEFDLEAPVTAAPAVPSQSAPMDFSGIDLELAAAPELAELGEPMVAEGEGSDVATKLELAQAYEEMGDREGARELLEEVVQEGSVTQQEQARAKLAALGA